METSNSQNFGHGSTKEHLDGSEAKKGEKKKSRSTKTNKPPDGNAKDSKVEKPSVVEANVDFIHYAHKLEYQLATTKEKIQSERKKFHNIISGLANYLEANGETSKMVENYLESLDSKVHHESPSISNFEKLFTTNKYQIVEGSEPKSTSNRKSHTANFNKDEQDKKTKPKTSKAKDKIKEPKKPKSSKAKATANEQPITQNNDDDLEIIEVSPPKTNLDDVQMQHPQENFFQNQQGNPNDLLQSYLMLQAANPSMQGFDPEQYERIAQEILKMGGNPQQYFGAFQDIIIFEPFQKFWIWSTLKSEKMDIHSKTENFEAHMA